MDDPEERYRELSVVDAEEEARYQRDLEEYRQRFDLLTGRDAIAGMNARVRAELEPLVKQLVPPRPPRAVAGARKVDTYDELMAQLAEILVSAPVVRRLNSLVALSNESSYDEAG